MIKQYLIINSLPEKNQNLIDLLAEFNKRGYSFCLASSEEELILQFEENKWPTKKIFLGPPLNTGLNRLIFIIFLPFLFLFYFLYLVIQKTKQKIRGIICLSQKEKIIFSPLAKALRIDNIWIEDNPPLNKGKLITDSLFPLKKMFSRWAKVVAPSNFTKIRLKEKGIREENIIVIKPAVKLNERGYQNNLFMELAQAERKNFRRKFFTIGTIINLSRKEKIEILLRAVKICQSIIPSLQLVVVGDGEERKNLTWLCKKMEIDHISWFVGEQKPIKKWLHSFDVFVETNENPKLSDYNVILKAMDAGIPIIAQTNLGLEEILGERELPFYPEDDYEVLATQIIKLWRDKQLRKRMGASGRERVEKFFSLEKQAEEFEKILI